MWSKVNRFTQSERGMSIVEVLMVVMIMTVVMVAVMALYLPAQRSTVVQTQLSDIQSDLRLALKTMTKDLLNAIMNLMELYDLHSRKTEVVY